MCGKERQAIQFRSSYRIKVPAASNVICDVRSLRIHRVSFGRHELSGPCMSDQESYWYDVG